MTRLALIVAMATLGGCAVLSNVTPIGDGVFMAAVHSNDVNARADQQTAQAMAQASAFCKERGAAVEVVRVDAPAPPFGRPPSAEVDFRCKAAS